MNNFGQDVLSELRKRVAERIISYVGAFLVILSPTLKLWAARLLSSGAISSIQYLLLCIGAAALIGVAWSLFLRTFRKLKDTERRLEEALAKPRHFLDDYDNSLVGKLGLWKHKTKTGLYCGHCTPQKIVAQVKEEDRGWRCLVCKTWFEDPDKPSPPSPPPTVPRWSRGFF